MDEISEKQALNKRLENISWGSFLILLGGLWLVPDRMIPQGAWLICAGLILLGLNVARQMNGIRMSGFSLLLGALALFSGISDFLKMNLPLLPIFLILIGANILIRPLIEKNQPLERKNHNEQE